MRSALSTCALLASILAIALLPGCITTSINPDAVERANRTLERIEARGPLRYGEQEKRLWQDQPAYAALLDGLTPIKRVRLVSAVVPNYPPLLRMGHVNAKVTVCFVVGIDGKVEAARVMESSDTRFNDSALEAIRQFTFLPASDAHGPARDVLHFPFDYFWDKKAIDAAQVRQQATGT
jgi:TonB family protein